MSYITRKVNGDKLPPFGKMDYLLEEIEGARLLVDEPTVWQENLVVVSFWDQYESAKYIVDQDELEHFRKNTIHGVLYIPNARLYTQISPTEKQREEEATLQFERDPNPRAGFNNFVKTANKWLARAQESK